jgi:hypothetical protein
LDPKFVDQLLQSVDVDYNDPLIQSALAQLGNKTDESESKTDKNEDSKKRKSEDEK